MALGIGCAASRRWQKEKYKTDPQYRQARLSQAAAYTKKEIEKDPQYRRLKIVRGTICRCRAQIQNHKRAMRELMDRREKRVAELDAKIMLLCAERDRMVSKRKKASAA